MKVIYGLGRLKKRFKSPVVALGVFDGFHLGHRRLIAQTVRRARALKSESLVITFWPHPQKILLHEKVLQHLISLKHRLEFFKALSVDYCLIIKFTKTFSNISAQDFIKNILIPKTGTREIFVGKNFRFGKDAEGDVKLLKANSRKFDYRLKILPEVKIDNRIISSSLIRRLIQKGRLDQAAKFLGRPVAVLGTVIKGNTLGRKLGSPTANINAHHEIIPPAGIYIVKIILKNKTFFGLCYIGSKPTFKNKFKTDKTSLHIEVHIFNFRKNIYGQDLQVEFIKKIRNEIRFPSRAQLIQRINEDISNARTFLKHYKFTAL